MQFTPDAVIRKIEALLNTKGCTEAEATSRIAKAQELMEAYGLEQAEIGRTGIALNASRKDQRQSGGLYGWQRKLWKGVAELNFCHYITIKGTQRGAKFEHRLIGSHANVVSSTMMAQYLQDTIERLAREWSKERSYLSVFVREAIAFREGCTDRIYDRLRARREEILTAARQEEERRKQREASAQQGSTSRALTILDVISTEEDFNNDYLHGFDLGTTARERAEHKRRQDAADAEYAKRRAEQEEYDRIHPEEEAARRKEAEEYLAELVARYNKKQAKRETRRRVVTPRYRKPTPEEERAGLTGYAIGQDAGQKVGIDTQVNDAKKPELLK